MTGITVQLGTLQDADIPDLRRFDSALLVIDWPDDVPRTLHILDLAGVKTGIWRFVTDPRNFVGWPGDYVARCDLALVDNEVDIESWNPWGAQVAATWTLAGGKIIEPAWSDEQKRTPPPYPVCAVSAHVYPLGRGAANLAAVRARAAARPVLVTEAGIAGQQDTILQQLAALGVTESTYLYSYRARDAQAQPAYDLAGVELLPVTTPAQNPPQSRQDGADATIAAKGKDHTLSIDAIPELQQGPTMLCWAECVQEAFAGKGKSVSVYDLYKQTKGIDYVAPGAPASFQELTMCVEAAAAMTGSTIKWFGPAGRVNDFATFDQLLRDGTWDVIVGANEQVLVNDLGLAETANYGHFFLCNRIDFNADGTPDTYTIDSYRAFDHVPVRIPLGAVHDAMAANWDSGYDALAFSVA